MWRRWWTGAERKRKEVLMYCVCVYVCRCACVVGGSEIITWQQSAVLIPLYLCLPSPPLNWEQMRVAGDDRPSEGRFNYRYSDRQDTETEKERGVKAVVVSGRTAELSLGPYCLFLVNWIWNDRRQQLAREWMEVWPGLAKKYATFSRFGQIRASSAPSFCVYPRQI